MSEESQPPAADRASLQRRAIRGAAWTMIHTVISLPIAFLVNLLLARVLGVVDYGRLTYLTMLITLASSVAAMGVGTAVLQFGTKAHSGGRPHEVRALLRSDTGWRLLVMAPVITVVVLVFVRLEPSLLILALVFGVWLPAMIGGLGLALNIEQKTAEGAQAALVGSFLTQGAVVASVLAIGTPDAVWAARTIAGVLVVLILVPFISRAYRRAVITPANPFRLPRSFWRFAIPAGLANMVAVLVTSRSEVLLLQWLSDPVSVGLFGLAFGLAVHLFAPAQAFIGPLVPAVSGLVEVDPGSVRPAFLRVLRCSAVISGIFVAGALPAFAALVPLLYGQEFARAADLVLALGMVTALGLVAGPITAFIYARLGGRVILRIELCALAVNLATAVALIPPLGAWGAVISSAIAVTTRTALLAIDEMRHLRVSARDATASTGALLLGIPTASLLWMATAGMVDSALARTVLIGLAGTTVLVSLVRVSGVGLTAADHRAIMAVVPRRLNPAAGVLLMQVVRRRA